MTYRNVPEEMKQARRWVLWRHEGRNGKKTKIPYQPNGRRASSIREGDWSCFQTVLSVVEDYDGIGFVLGADETVNWLGIDFDDVLENGEWVSDEARALVESAGTYAELSPSGTGVHVIGWGRKMGERCRKSLKSGEIEVYDGGRYFTVTGARISHETHVKMLSDAFLHELDAILQVYRPELAPVGLNPSDEEILRMIRASAQGAKFDALYNGSTVGYPSRSEAVYALIGIVNWWTRDASQTERIVSTSSVIDRKKWARLGAKECATQLAEANYADAPPWDNSLSPTGIEEAVEALTGGKMAKVATKPRYHKLRLDLPKEHFVRRYVEHYSAMTDAYPDYHYVSALAMLSAAANGILQVRMKNFGGLKTNLWFLMLGQSSFSRKSTAMKPAMRYLGENERLVALPGSFTPESLIEVLDEDEKCYHLKDEAAQILSSMNQKAYMADMRDLFCQLYDGTPFSRTLRSKANGMKTRFRVDDPYLTLQWATTPENFLRSSSMLDATSGFLYRFLPVFPRYPKETMPLELGTPDADYVDMQLMSEVQQLADLVNTHTLIDMRPSPEAMARYNTWMTTRQAEYEAGGPRCAMHSSILARYVPVVVKLASLLALGDREFRRTLHTEGNRMSAPVPDWAMDEAVRIVDEYFIPVQVELLQSLQSHEEDNMQERILAHVRDNGGVIKYSDLMRATRIRARDLREHLEALELANEIEIEQIERTDGRGGRGYAQIRTL